MIKILLLIASLSYPNLATAFELRLPLNSLEIDAGNSFWSFSKKSYLTLTDGELSVTLVCADQTLTVGEAVIKFTYPDEETCHQKVNTLESFLETNLISEVTFVTGRDESGNTRLETLFFK